MQSDIRMPVNKDQLRALKESLKCTQNPLLLELLNQVSETEAELDSDLRLRAIEDARNEYQTDECRIDYDAEISPTDDGAVWVQAWVYLEGVDLEN